MCIRTVHLAELEHCGQVLSVSGMRWITPEPFRLIGSISEIYQVTGPVERLAGQIASHGYIVGVSGSSHDHPSC